MFKKHQILVLFIYIVCETFCLLEAFLKLQNWLFLSASSVRWRAGKLAFTVAGSVLGRQFHFQFSCVFFITLQYSYIFTAIPKPSSSSTQKFWSKQSGTPLISPTSPHPPPLAEAQHCSKKDEGETVESMREILAARTEEPSVPRLWWNKVAISGCVYLSVTVKAQIHYGVLLKKYVLLYLH